MSQTHAKMATEKGRILIVEDEANSRKILGQLFSQEGYVVELAADGYQALRMLEAFEPDVVLTDLMMPVLDGMSLVEQGRVLSPHAAFVMMTASGSIDSAVRAIQLGAENYLTKPLELDAVSALVLRACEKAKLSRETGRLRERLELRFNVSSIVGDHPAMTRLVSTIAQVAASKATVLIHGASGTGKELIAAAVHQHSPRKARPFVRLNCASLAESLLESELFGHEKGAFTGAVSRREGRFKQADGGTLFLDEVSEIPLAVQVKLLRFLQERQFERVGGNETLTVDVRIVAATNRDLKERVSEGRFREDLFYRLNVVQLEVPPLCARRSDIPLLAMHFLRRFAKENERDIRGFTDAALRGLLSYPWPGNVRELENAIERAVVMCNDPEIGAEHLPSTGEESPAQAMNLFVPGITMAEVERMVIMQTLDACGGSTSKAAEILDISQRKIQYRAKEWGLPTTRSRDDEEPALD